MTIQGKQALITAIVAGALIVGINIIPDGKTELCTVNQCYHLTAEEYSDLKQEVSRRVEAGTPIDYSDFTLYVAIVDREARAGNMNLSSVTEDNLIERINAKLNEK